VGFDFRDLRKAGLEHTVFRIEQVTLPEDRTAWAGRTGMYQATGWARNELLDIDPTTTFYSGADPQDGTLKYNHDTDTYVAWDDDDWELKIEHDGAYKWAWMICFEIELIGATSVSDTDFSVQIRYENIESGDSDKIYCFNTREKVGSGGHPDWDTGAEIYAHDNNKDYWGDSVETTAFQSTGTKWIDLGSTGDQWFNSYWLPGGSTGFMTFWVRESGHEDDEKVKCWSREDGTYDPRLEVEYSIPITAQCDTLVSSCSEKCCTYAYCFPDCFPIYWGSEALCGCTNGDPRIDIDEEHEDTAAYLESLGYCPSWYQSGYSDYDYTYSINGHCRYQAIIDDEDENFIEHIDGPEPNTQLVIRCNPNGCTEYPCVLGYIAIWHEACPP
jgi:hypothetical protein